MTSQDVLVTLGLGDMGMAITRRVSADRLVVIADRDADLLETRGRELADSGHRVEAIEVDVSSIESVDRLVERSRGLGQIRSVVHTAGVSPSQASVEAILAVDLLGTAIVIDAFGQAIAPQGAGVIISSMAAHLTPLPSQAVQRNLALTATSELLSLDCVSPAQLPTSAQAYALAKQANNLRVAAHSKRWGERGATLNAVSPGIISTAMGREELAGSSGAIIRGLITRSGAGRAGTPDDVASAAAFLLGPDARFITGTALLVDGGVRAATQFG